MANLIIQENGVARTTPALHGEEITIQTPCDCSAVTGVQIAGVAYPFYDAAGNPMESGSGLFAKDSLIRVLIDTVNTRSTIINHAITAKGAAIYNVTIGTSWVENEDTGVKSQNVAINGITAEHTAKVDHAYTGNKTSDSYATFVEEENQYLTYITNGYAETYDGGITFYIFGDANTVSIPIVVEVT